MEQRERARAFAALHVKGKPLILFNVWDAGSAKTVAEAGATAVATGSWSVAAAQGFADGQQIPVELLAAIVRRIAGSVELPLTVDMEGGYGVRPEEVARTAELLLGCGAVGVNFEDQRVGGQGLYEVAEQAARVSAVRHSAEAAGVPLFINARTDLFLKERDRTRHVGLLSEAKERAQAYADAGASGFFAPGLVGEEAIAELCDAVPLPVNVMMLDGAPAPARLAALGVSRISHGPRPYIAAMTYLREQAAEALRPT